MATEEELLESILNKSGSKIISMSYEFNEGEITILELPVPKEQIDACLTAELTTKHVGDLRSELTTLLYYKALSNLPDDKSSKITGKVSIDKNLYDVNNTAAKTPASACFVRSEEKVCLRPNMFTGNAMDIVNDFVNILHESRHYNQFLSGGEYVKHLDGSVEGSMSEMEKLKEAYHKFGVKKLFPNATEKEIQDYSYALYHQSENEVDARDYSLAQTEKILKDALAQPISDKLIKVRLEILLEEVQYQIKNNNVANIELGGVAKEVVDACQKAATYIQQQCPTMLSPENIEKLEHYSEANEETENIREYIFGLEASLFINYDENIARLIEKIATTYKVYAVGRTLIKHPEFKPSEKLLDTLIKDDIFILFGASQISPPYSHEEVAKRYAKLNATKTKQ